MFPVFQPPRFEPVKKLQQIRCVAEVMRVHLVALAIENPSVPRNLAAGHESLFDRQSPGRQHRTKECSTRFQHPPDLGDTGADHGFISVIDDIPAEHVIAGSVRQRQIGHASQVGGYRQSLLPRLTFDDRQTYRRRVDRFDRVPQPGKRQGVASDARAQIEDARTRRMGLAPIQNFGLGLRPFRRSILPLNVPMLMCRVGSHLSPPITLRRRIVPACSTAMTTTAIIRMTVIAV